MSGGNISCASLLVISTMKLFRRRRGKYTLNTIKENALERADPLPSDRQPAVQPDTSPPKRGRQKANKRGVPAVLRRICPCFFKKKKKDDSMASSNVPSNGVIQMKLSSSASSTNAKEPFPPAPGNGGSQPIPSAQPEIANESNPPALDVGGSKPVSAAQSDGANQSNPPDFGISGNEPITLAKQLSSSDLPCSTKCPLSMECFSFKHLLGEGGFGKVMLASHRDTGRQVAIKMVKKRRLKGNFTGAQIERDILLQNRHIPFLTGLLGSFQTEQYLLYVMEYLSGGDLHDLIDFEAPFCGIVLRTLTAEILCGLQNLHERGIMHRDLKPDNVLLDSLGHCQISDFGLSVPGMFYPKTIKGYAGTINFVAPEVLMNDPYDITADYFSLGVIVFKMATGYHPYYKHGMDRDEVAFVILEENKEYPQDIDPDVKKLIEVFMDPDPDYRRLWLRSIRAHPFFQDIDWANLESGDLPPLGHSTPCQELPIPQSQSIRPSAIMSPVPDSSTPTDYQWSVDSFSFISEGL